MSETLFSILTLNLWGKIADKYGNYKVIALTTILIPLTPLLWIISTNKIYLFLVPALIGGTSWTAFLMVSGNFIYDNIGKEKRGKAISNFNLFLGIGAFIGGMIGAILIETINTTWIEPIYLIFIIGAIARLIIVSFWIPKIKEIKHKRKLKNLKELEKTLLKETKPTIKEDLHEIMRIKSYIKER
jgi:MFS family permease